MTSENSGTVHCDVAIIGAGPAGLAAASALIESGASVCIFDEQPRPGGQITRQPPRNFRVKNWLKGSLYRSLKQNLSRMEDHPAIDWKLSVTVSGITGSQEEFFQVWYQGASGLSSVTVRRILVATGCYEQPLVFPGATTPGVMGAGAIQTLLKSQQILAGDRFLFAGVHPLQLLVADQIVAAGGKVTAVIFAQPFFRCLSLLKHLDLLITHAWTFLAAMGAYRRLGKAGVDVHFSQAVTAVEGTNRIKKVHISPLSSNGAILKRKPVTREVDCLGLCYGFQASSELARQAGAESHWSPHQGGWLIRHNRWGESSSNGLYVAGEITGMTGANAGAAEGRIAGAGLALSLGKLTVSEAEKQVKKSRKILKKELRFANFLTEYARLPDELVGHLQHDDSLLCRCENIRCQDIRLILHQNPQLGKADSIKLISRVGMGMCQGRLCYASFAELVCRETGKSAEEIGPFQVQWPVKPLLIRDLPENKPDSA